MTTTLVHENAKGSRLELKIEPERGPKLKIITKDEQVVYAHNYEYWEVSLATRDFWAMVDFLLPGEGSDEDAVSGDAGGESGDDARQATGRVLRPRKNRSRGKRAGAQVGAVSVPVGDDHRG